jgi:hypothetical protein
MNTELNVHAILLDSIHTGFDRSVTERLLEHLDGAVRRSAAVIDGLPTDNPDYADAVTDDECNQIEELLGIGFVMCQVAIKSVVAAVLRLNRYHLRTSGADLVTATRRTAMRHALPACVGPYTALEILNAGADYYKHRDEWGLDWEKLPRLQAETAKVIMAAGAERGSTGNLRRLAKTLGNAEYDRMTRHCELISAWSSGLASSYRDELQALGVLRTP